MFQLLPQRQAKETFLRIHSQLDWDQGQGWVERTLVLATTLTTFQRLQRHTWDTSIQPPRQRQRLLLNRSPDIQVIFYHIS